MKLVWPWMALLLVVGCGTAPPRDNNAASQGQSLMQAERIARSLAGDYAGPASGRETEVDLVRLQVEIERVGAQSVSIHLRQIDPGAAQREFRLLFEPSRLEGRLGGRFSPLGPDGTILGSCPLEVIVQEPGFVARTLADTCRFGAGDGASALIKEIAHDGRTLVIADRVIDPESGDPRIPDRVLELQRLAMFEGWAGVRARAGGDWRVAKAFELRSDGVAVVPVDAAGMPLDVELELAPYRVSEQRPAVLRLRVFAADSGELIGQSWAALDSLQIGLALPRLQIGLMAP